MSLFAINACFFVAICTAVVCVYGAVLISRFRTFGTAAKSKDAPTRWNAASKPLIGGLIFFPVFVLGVVLWPPFESSQQNLGLLLSGTGAFVLGLLDDLYRLSARSKFIGQVAVALCLALFGQVELHVLASDDVFAHLVNAFITVFLVVGCMNSVNMMDNMDAVSTVSVLPVLVVASLLSPGHIGFELFFLSGLLAFLVFNRYPSKIFMGDSGSMLLGFIVALTIIQSLSRFAEFNFLQSTTFMVFTCTIFLVDSLVVILNRMRHGVSPAQGGRDHTSHNLVYSGLSEPQVMVLFLMVGVMQVFLFRLISTTDWPVWIGFTFATVYFVLYFFIMWSISRINLRKERFTYKK